ncbi:MAG: ferredoxin--nitrite reductase [SAR202 cluster bacterium]|nr:ferredoxin--nitrite reductase [SAR202 cluster bacterium]
MKPGNNPIERHKAEKDGLDILGEIEELAAQHGGWETLEAGDRERLKWIGTFFRKPTPGQFMMRIRITNGQATSGQFRVLADIARRLGNGVLDLTTRQQIQLRAIKIKDVPQILEALRGVDLTSLQTGLDNIRNVGCCPLAGLTDAELFDASPAGFEYAEMFLNNKEFSNLPRKFNVTITGCLENCTHSETQDLGMVPAVRRFDGAFGFNVMVGGKMGSGGMTVAQPLNVFVVPQEAARLAAAITLLFRDEGSREKRTKNRLAFLIEEWGIDRFRDCLEERWGQPLERAQEDARNSDSTDHLGVHSQNRPGLSSVGLCVPTGRLSSEHLDDLARLADTYGSGELRLTTNQNVILINVVDAVVADLLTEPLLEEFSPNSNSFNRGLVTCTGTDYCNLALIETKRIGRDLAATMAKQFPQGAPVTMYWSGCPAGCGNHHAADIGFQGAKARVDGKIVDAVNIFVGGRTGTSPKTGEKIMELVPVAELGEVVPVILQDLYARRSKESDGGAESRVVMVLAGSIN